MGDIRKSSRVSPRRGGGGGGGGGGDGGAGRGEGRGEEIVSRIKYAEEEEEEEEEEENKTVVRIDRARNGATFQRARRIVRELSFTLRGVRLAVRQKGGAPRERSDRRRSTRTIDSKERLDLEEYVPIWLRDSVRARLGREVHGERETIRESVPKISWLSPFAIVR
ncbi:hypothetical protein HZH68_013080 [Vespula germanica]|uniref:Uncharacterized protein n=1 Tax=Vespula germanica TaxID=30212 RepID=A0A834JF12_VESGE|nr:hypothetical protein HZH68_013080 [Vespula germanica]